MKAQFFLTFTAIVFLFLFQGCQSCSESGRKAARENLLNTPKKSSIQKQNELIEQTPLETENVIVSTSDEQSLTDLYNTLSDAVLFIITIDENGNGRQGSGFSISPDGICISNYHVFSGTLRGQEEVYIDEQGYRVDRILAQSEDLDYIIFKLENASNIPYVRISPSEPNIGENAFAIGNPQGLDKTLSQGIISQFRKDRDLIQTTTEITNGSSGGPLFNMKGEVIGITSSGMGEANINFAINIQRLPYKSHIY